ncbi:MAG: potassium channel family protein [Rikenellaceae bacterium]
MGNGIKSLLYTPFGRLKWVMDVLVIIGSLIIVSSVSVDFFNNRSLEDGLDAALRIQYWVCMLYIADFFIRLWSAENKTRFFFRNLPLLIISIPYYNITSYYDVSLDQEWATILRILPVIRCAYAIVLFFNRRATNIISTLIVSYITTVVFVCYFSTMIFFYAERGVNPMVKNYGDALWWTLMNLTTVGSNIFAVTPLGKFLSFAIAATGMMMFPIFTAYVTEIFQEYHKRRHSK